MLYDIIYDIYCIFLGLSAVMVKWMNLYALKKKKNVALFVQI